MACGAEIEQEVLSQGFRLIAGIDEVGRGAVAGPVVAAAVIIDLLDVPDGINDSKQLTRAQREEVVREIERRALAISIARVEHDEIDRINIHEATLLAMRLAAKALQPKPDYALIDGRHEVPHLGCPQKTIIKGDSLSVSIGAASIVAKVARDRLMSDYDAQYPGYGFAEHAGYNTRFHQEAILRLGASDIHRKTFRGVNSYQQSFAFTD